MPLHPKLKELVEASKTRVTTFDVAHLEEMRQATMKLSLLAGDVEHVMDIKSVLIEGDHGSCLARIYRPVHEMRPVLLYFHPGGFVKGDVETHDPICRRIANRLNAVVVSLNYRLAPEFQFPSQLQDAYRALEWIYREASEIGGDKTKIGVAGESSGGNLAAVLSLMARDRNGPKIKFQGLIYPQLDYTMSFPSHKVHQDLYLVTDEALKFYAECYIPTEVSTKHPYVSPYFAENFHDLPETLIITAEYDGLRDEAEAFGKKLIQSGCNCCVKRFDGMIHGFFQMSVLAQEADLALDLLSERFLACMH